MARAVGPTGTVWAQDPATIIERLVKDKFDNRARSPAMTRIFDVLSQVPGAAPLTAQPIHDPQDLA